VDAKVPRLAETKKRNREKRDKDQDDRQQKNNDEIKRSSVLQTSMDNEIKIKTRKTRI
jgi:hypothetical protein